MKKALLIAGIVIVLVSSTGCGKDQPLVNQPPTSSTTISTPENFDYKEYIKTPDVLNWKAGKEIRDKIVTELKAGKSIQEISEPRKLSLPSDIYPPQFGKFFQLDDIRFAIVQVMSGVDFGQWDQKTTTSSGIWYADKNDTAWQPLLTLTHAGGYAPFNNIFDFWGGEGRLNILMTDSNGAGSGDGTTKIISSNELDKNWKINRCIYLSGGFYDFQKKIGVISVHKALPQWLKSPLNHSATFEYTFNSSTSKFETIRFDSGSGKNEVELGENCQNISFP